MYLKGSKLSMTRRRKPLRPWRILILLLLIGGALYVNQVIVPATPPLFIPTPTPTLPPEYYSNLARGLAEEGKLAQAIVAYKDAIKISPREPGLYVELARLQIYTSQYQDAIQTASDALVLNQKNATALALRGWALGLDGNYLEAINALKQAEELEPNNPVPYAYHAEILALQQQANQGGLGTLEEAIELSKKAQSLGPNSLEAHRARGYILEITQNNTEAIAEFEAAIAINPNIADLHMALGRNYRAVELYDKAYEEFNKAIPLDPTNPLPKLYLSRTYETVGEYARAIQYGEMAIKDDPSDPYLHGNLGILFRRNGEIPKAIQSLRLAVRGGTTEDGTVVEGLPLDYGRIAQFYYTYGLALATGGECAEAIQISATLLQNVSADDIAVYNAQEIINICAQQSGLITPTPPGNE
ncbi:MAG TPA: tetratricopeptide repeat protein [Anaerolineaceae bacterium]|nr:tetratricopeptide repeat protein [Anaerolineaceae bacterium]HOU42745.1 tetratricopeptide repeat protein [Anaerolineaceae bacterium]HPA32117.1 tetratricopeptide repeat protein [Anaerolineaceae bacterium]HQF45225.1 tetratricopeptide repeat protein [Anaerolineaceae bacterium]HQH35046.1 tetratricopeptide repeat protein [Anaerolineaceae bacterium]